MSKKQNLHTKGFAENKLVESTDHGAGLSDATSMGLKGQNSDEGLKCINSSISGSQSFCGSFMIPVTTLCIAMFVVKNVQVLPAKSNLLPERKSLNVEVLFIK